MQPPGLLPKLRSARRRRKPKRRPIRAPSLDRMERRNGLLFLTFPPPFSTLRFQPPAAVEADGPLVVAGTVAVELTAMVPLLPTRLPLDRPHKAQSRPPENEDVMSLVLDVPPRFPRSQDDPLAPTLVRQLMRARLPRPPSEAVERVMARRTPVSR